MKLKDQLAIAFEAVAAAASKNDISSLTAHKLLINRLLEKVEELEPQNTSINEQESTTSK